MDAKTRYYVGFVRSAAAAMVAWTALAATVPAGAPDSGPYLYESWQTFTTRDGLPDDRIRAIHVSRGVVWVGTDRGLARYENDRWRSWTKSDGLPSPAITAIEVDSRTGDVWLGTLAGGLVRFSGGRFDSFTQFNSGLTGNLVFSVAVVGDRVFAATNGGVCSLDTTRDRWSIHLDRSASSSGAVVTDLVHGPGGERLYASSWCGKPLQYDLRSGGWTAIDSVPGSGSARNGSNGERWGEVNLAVAVAGDVLWSLTRDGLWRRDAAGAWARRSLEPRIGSKIFVRSMTASGDGEVWLGTDRGLHVVADWGSDTWITYRRCTGESGGLAGVTRNGSPVAARRLDSVFPSNRVACIAFDGDDVWVGTDVGLARGTKRTLWRRAIGAEMRAEAGRNLAAELACDPGAEDPPSSPGLRGVRGSAVERANGPAVEGVTVAAFGQITKTITLAGASGPGDVSIRGPNNLAIQLAIGQDNEFGGYRGRIPFRLTIGTRGYSRYGWGLPEDDLAILSTLPEVLGIVASLPAGERMATAAALLAECPIVNSADHIATVDESINPWIYRCPSDDFRHQRRLVDYLADNLGITRMAILRTPGVMSGYHLGLWRRAIYSQPNSAVRLVAEVEYDPAVDPLDEQLATLWAAEPEAILTWCELGESARILRRVRELGITSLFVGSEAIVSENLVQLVGREPGAVIAPYPCPHRKNREAIDRFAERYISQGSTARGDRPPDVGAWLAYHATRHLLQAINIGGGDRLSIRRALASLDRAAVAVLENNRWKRTDFPGFHADSAEQE